MGSDLMCGKVWLVRSGVDDGAGQSVDGMQQVVLGFMSDRVSPYRWGASPAGRRR
jgi:hypothetical protein